MPTLFVVGDSTLASFNDITYYYPRYGYATQLNNYFNDELKIKNYALSGRSSKSFVKDSNYNLFLNEIKEGDFLLIGFGHNDEKEDDISRFTYANKNIDDKSSFKYSLYNNYIKIAIEKGATPIISTPVARLSKKDEYSGFIIHQTNNGDYKKAILDLANELNIVGIDLTTPSTNLYKELGYNNALYHHAITQGKKVDGKIIADIKATDNTHLNLYGAKYIAYFFVKGLKNTNSKLKKYLKNELLIPNINDDLKINPTYKFHDYSMPNLDINKYYNTTIGDMNKEDNDIKLINDKIILSNNTNSGKFVATSDAFNYYFKQIDKKYNFNVSAKAKILKLKYQKQAGLGIMVRDDIYFNEKIVLASNFISCGILTMDESMYMNFYREAPAEIAHDVAINQILKEDDEVYFNVKRLGQKITISLKYKNKEYNKEFFDFDLNSIDNKNIYAGIFVAKDMVVEFSDFFVEVTTLAMEA